MPTGKISPISSLTGKIDRYGGTDDHNKLINRDLTEQHPIEAITGLKSRLEDIDSKISTLDEKIDSGADSVAHELELIRQEIIEVNNSLLDLINSTKDTLNNLSVELRNEIISLQNSISIETQRAQEIEQQLQVEISNLENQQQIDKNSLLNTITKAKEELHQSILTVESNFLKFKQIIEAKTNSLQEQLDNTSIESLSKRKIYQLCYINKPDIDDCFYKAVIFDPTKTYFEYDTELNAYRRIILDSESFIPNTYYIYIETSEETIDPTTQKEVKKPGYYPAYKFDSNAEYYVADYSANTDSMVGIWQLPEQLPYVGDWPNNTVTWINDAPGYYYNDDGTVVNFKRFGCLAEAYSGWDNKIWGIAVGEGWNGMYGIQEFARYAYPDTYLGREGYANFRGSDQDAMRTLYFTQEVDPYILTSFKTLNPEKLSDVLLPYGNTDYEYTLKYVSEPVTEDTFKPGKYYTKFDQVTKPVIPDKTDYMIKSKNYKAGTIYYKIIGYNEFTNDPIYDKVGLTEEEFYSDPTIDYYKIISIQNTLKVLDVTRLELAPEKNIIRNSIGEESLVIENEDIFVKGTRLAPKLTVSNKETLNRILEDNAEITISEQLANLCLTIPADIKHGFCSYLTFEAVSNRDPVISITNLSKFNFRIIRDNEVIRAAELRLTSDCQYNLLFICNGVNIELYIQEIQLI